MTTSIRLARGVPPRHWALHPVAVLILILVLIVPNGPFLEFLLLTLGDVIPGSVLTNERDMQQFNPRSLVGSSQWTRGVTRGPRPGLR